MNEEAWEPRGGNDSIWRKVAFVLGFQEWRGVSGREVVYNRTRVLKRSRWLREMGVGVAPCFLGTLLDDCRGGSVSSSKEP